MRYVVGYGPNQRGRDGINLAVTLARTRKATLDIVAVLPGDAPSFHMYSPDRAYNTALEKQGQEWLDDAMTRVPDDVTAAGHLRRAESITEGLVEEANDPDRGDSEAVIVVGTSHRVKVGRLRLGSIADALLHSASVPVVLAPVGYEALSGITRITCATGTREGAEALLEVAIREAASRRIPLRLMSLVKVARDGSAEQRAEWTGMAEGHVARLASKAEAELPPECEVTSVVGDGESLEEAVQALDFAESEIVMVGSSRLAQPKRLFIGASVNKILRALPVPMMVVPRDYELSGDD
ncbi:MAG: universal stress protein [Solirubrobacterales bacterium]|nr:universal stress protein [Solirubrobacterales bacterium]